MASLKSLLKDTAIYGISSIAGRFVNYLLVPIETYAWVAGGGQFGVITNVYSYIGILIIALTFGMETTFFRFANKEGENARMVYSTALRMVGAVALVFALLVLACLKPLAAAMGYADHVWYIGTMAVCVAVDAWTAIMFDYLRYQHKPWKFMALKLANILINVALVGAFLFVLPHFGLFIPGLYDANGTPDVGIVFYVNLFVSVVTVLLLSKEMTGVSYGFDKALCRRMLSYTWPMLILGIAGQLNQSASTIIFPYLFDGDIAEAHAQLGIYGATIKIAMIMVIITQAFRLRAVCLWQQGRRQEGHLRQGDEVLHRLHPLRLLGRHRLHGHFAPHCGALLLGGLARGSHCDGRRNHVWRVFQPQLLV